MEKRKESFYLILLNRRYKEGIKVMLVNNGTEWMETCRVGIGNSWKKKKRVGPKLS